MKNRLQFKLIAFLILLSLIALEAIQGFWLKNFYDSVRKQTVIQINEAIKVADYRELFIRLDEIKKETSSPFQHSIDINMPDSFRKINPPLDNTSLQIHIREDNEDEENIIDMLPEYLSLIGELEQIIISGMHTSIDSMRPVNYNIFVQSLEEELNKYDIYASAQLEIFGREDTPIYTAFLNNPREKEIKEGKQSLTIEYSFLQDGGYYRLTLQNPQSIILWKMAGILVTSAILSLLVIGVFIYLFRTIVHQKTEEELKTDFTNNVTHELKTPIAVARAANEALLNYDENVTEKQKKYLGVVEDQLTRLTGMVEQILSLSVENRSTFRLNIQPVNIMEILLPIIEQQKLKTNKQVNITLDLPGEVVIQADKVHLNTILTNLLDNAIKYTTGEVVNIHISATMEENHIILSVSDKGKGISEEHQKRIFDKFYRVPQGNLHNVKGYGLGLYYISDTMKRHNGSVTVKSRPGEGSVFTLKFQL